jgi:glycogen synthase
MIIKSDLTLRIKNHAWFISRIRAVCGLDDSVVVFSQNAARATGIKFHEYSSRALAKAMRKALALYQHPNLLERYRRNAMKTDFSWDHTVREYLKVYAAAKSQRWTRLASTVQNANSHELNITNIV